MVNVFPYLAEYVLQDLVRFRFVMQDLHDH
jgi:hypothetical protein